MSAFGRALLVAVGSVAYAASASETASNTSTDLGVGMRAGVMALKLKVRAPGPGSDEWFAALDSIWPWGRNSFFVRSQPPATQPCKVTVASFPTAMDKMQRLFIENEDFVLFGNEKGIEDRLAEANSRAKEFVEALHEFDFLDWQVEAVVGLLEGGNAMEKLDMIKSLMDEKEDSENMRLLMGLAEAPEKFEAMYQNVKRLEQELLLAFVAAPFDTAVKLTYDFDSEVTTIEDRAAAERIESFLLERDIDSKNRIQNLISLMMAEKGLSRKWAVLDAYGLIRVQAPKLVPNVENWFSTTVQLKGQSFQKNALMNLVLKLYGLDSGSEYVANHFSGSSYYIQEVPNFFIVGKRKFYVNKPKFRISASFSSLDEVERIVDGMMSGWDELHHRNKKGVVYDVILYAFIRKFSFSELSKVLGYGAWLDRDVDAEKQFGAAFVLEAIAGDSPKTDVLSFIDRKVLEDPEAKKEVMRAATIVADAAMQAKAARQAEADALKAAKKAEADALEAEAKAARQKRQAAWDMVKVSPNDYSGWLGM